MSVRSEFTPAHKYNSWAKEKSSGATPMNDEEERRIWAEEERRLDREWYSLDEGQIRHFNDVSEEYTQKKEIELEVKRQKRLSANQREINKINEQWEVNRMLTSGVVSSMAQKVDLNEEEEARVHLLVNNIVPPFLDGRIVFTKQPEPVVPVRDPTSDMAQVSRKGSHLVRVNREQKERKKAQKKHWELAGTNIGNIMGVKDTRKEDREDPHMPETDFKAGQKFAQHMNQDDGKSQSKFAKIQKQRKTLPVFAVKQDLLKVIRENDIVVIVGETGSGKTTQLTQYLHEDGYTKNGMIGCTQVGTSYRSDCKLH